MKYLPCCRISIAIITIIFSSFFIGSSVAQSVEAQHTEIAQKLDRYLSNAVPYGFSGQVLVEKGNQVLMSESYGFADREHRVPMTRNTMIGIASMSKQFCAAAILKLKDEGKLSLDDTLADYFQEVPEDKAGITIHQLLTHTSGLRRSKNSDFEIAGREELAEDIFSTSLAFEPGTDWRYSDGYSIAALIIERVSGQRYRDFMTEHLFMPANLQNTILNTGPYPESTQIAHSYVGWIDKGSPREWPANFRNFGTGDVLSTATDLHRWITALEQGKILSPESLTRFWSAQTRIEDRPVYAYGWFIHEEPADTVIEHGGDAALGHNGGIFIHKNSDVNIFITTNTRTPNGDYVRHAVTRDIERIVLNEEEQKINRRSQAALADSVQRDKLTGTYELQEGGRVHVMSDGAYLWMAAEGQPAVNLLTRADEQQAVQFERGNDKTDALLQDLLVKRPDAFEKALTEERIRHLESYRSNWEELTATLGPLNRYEIRGSTPFFDNVETIAKLHFRDASIEMSFLWMNHGSGPIRGTARFGRIEYPVALPAALTPEGNLVVHDLFGGDTFIFTISGQRPEIRLHYEDEGTESILTRKGLAGWGR